MKIMDRRTFAGAMGAAGMGVVLAGCAAEPKPAKEAETAASTEASAETTDAAESVDEGAGWAPTATNLDVAPLFPDSAPCIYTDEEIEEILNNRAQVTEPWVNEDGTEVSAAHIMARNVINRNGIGMGSLINRDHQLDLWPTLLTEEEAQAISEMPMYEMFTAADFAKVSGRSEEECLKLCNQIADKSMIRRIWKDGEPTFNTVGSEYGYYEAYVMNFTPEYLELKNLNQADDMGLAFLDSETSMYRTLPVDLDVVVDGNYTQWDDWRDIFKRHDTFTVSPCMCRTHQMLAEGQASSPQEILEMDKRRECKHPVRTCISTGVQAEYFKEIGAGEEITAEEAISIIEEGVDLGMIVETVYTKAAESVCLCHADCCLNVGAVRKLNGGPAMVNYSNFNLMHKKDECIKCGTCVQRCPMMAITLDDDGYPIVDSACVRCGQCATVCPQGVRALELKPESELPRIPEDMLDDYISKARVRIGKGYCFDITSQADMEAIVAKVAEGQA